MTDQLVLGASASYIIGSADLSNGGSIDADGERGQLYAVWCDRGLHFEGMIGGGSTSYDTRRAALGGFAKGSTDGLEWDGLLGGGYDWQSGNWRFGPQAMVQYISANVDGFTEKGSTAPLHIDSQTQDALRSQLGGRLSYRFYVEGTWTFVTPEVSVGWRHEYMDTSIGLDSRLAGVPGNTFTTQGPDLGSDSLVASVGLTIQWKPSISSFISGATQQWSGGYDSYAVNGGWRIAF
jgi:outer membrane autotransporter protein